MPITGGIYNGAVAYEVITHTIETLLEDGLW